MRPNLLLENSSMLLTGSCLFTNPSPRVVSLEPQPSNLAHGSQSHPPDRSGFGLFIVYQCSACNRGTATPAKPSLESGQATGTWYDTVSRDDRRDMSRHDLRYVIWKRRTEHSIASVALTC